MPCIVASKKRILTAFQTEGLTYTSLGHRPRYSERIVRAEEADRKLREVDFLANFYEVATLFKFIYS